jgi:repressor LexA
MRGLTPRQYQVLEYIRQSIRDRGYPPTLREIGGHMGIRSTNGVNDHLRALETKGYLTRDDMKSRSLRPTNLPLPGMTHVQVDDEAPSSPTSSAHAPVSMDEDIVEIRVLGRVAAGFPILADENVIDTVRIDRGMLNVSANSAREVFGLRVSGDSMIEAGIMHGDYLFVRRVETAQRGEIVVALIGDEATVKYYFPEKDHVRFQPANHQMAAILVRATDFRKTMILGVVVGIYRRL